MILNVHIMFGHQHTQALFRRQITCKHSLGNYIERSIKLQRIDNAPTPCTLLSGSIQYAIYQITSATLLMTENSCRYLNQVALQTTLVPTLEHVSHLLILQSQQILQRIIGLCYQFHVTIFYTVVHHLHIMTGTARTYPLATRTTVFGTGCNTLQHRLYEGPCLLSTARHDGCAMQCTFFASGNAATYKIHSFLIQFLYPALRILKIRVSTIDYNITFMQQGKQSACHFVYCRPCLHHEKYDFRSLQCIYKFLQSLRTDNAFALRTLSYEIINYMFFFAGNCAIPHSYFPSFTCQVQGQILPHHSQSDQSDICLFHNLIFLYLTNGRFICSIILSL